MGKAGTLTYLVVILFAVLVVTWLISLSNKENQAMNLNEALEQSAEMFAEFKRSATTAELAKGPCLGTIPPRWAVDIVSKPRQPIDNQQENQCNDTNHQYLIEISREGELLTVR